MKRVIYALAANCQQQLQLQIVFECEPLEGSSYDKSTAVTVLTSQNESIASTVLNKRVLEIFEGVSLMLFYTTKGVKGRLHSKAIDRLNILWNLLMQSSFSSDLLESIESAVKVKQGIANNNNNSSSLSSSNKKKGKKAKHNDGEKVLGTTYTIDYFTDLSVENRRSLELFTKPDMIWKSYTCGRLLAFCLVKLFRHLHPMHLTELWQMLVKQLEQLTSALRILGLVQNIPSSTLYSLHSAVSFVLEIVIFGICHFHGRGMSNKAVVNTVGSSLIAATLDLCEQIILKSEDVVTSAFNNDTNSSCGNNIIQRARLLLCQLWIKFPSHNVLVGRIDRIIGPALMIMTPTPATAVFAKLLLPALPFSLIQQHFMHPLLSAMASTSDLITCTTSTDSTATTTVWLETLLGLLMKIQDYREDYNELAAKYANTAISNNNSEKSNSSALKKSAKEDNWDDRNDSEEEEDSDDSDDDNAIVGSDEDNDSDSSEEKNEEDALPSNQVALTTLLHDSQFAIELVRFCFAIVQKTTRSLLSSLQTVTSASTMKTSNSDISNIEANNNAALALKCLLWFLHCCPDILTQDETICSELTELCGQLARNIIVDNNNNTPSSSTIVTKLEQHHFSIPLLADLITMTALALNILPLEQFNTGNKKSQQFTLVSYANATLRLLMNHPDSVSLTGSVNALLTLFKPKLVSVTASEQYCLLRIFPSDAERTALVQVVGTALTTASHWLRYNWLRILSHLPPTRFQSSSSSSSSDDSKDAGKDLNIAKICLEAVCLSPEIRLEREYARRIGTLEVLVRSGRLSHEYLRLICGYCLGLLHVKFKPIWEPAVLVLVTAAKLTDGEVVMWPLLLQAIQATTSVSTITTVAAAADTDMENSNSIRQPQLLSLRHLLDLTRQYDNGVMRMSIDIVCSELFAYKFSVPADQLVEPDARADSETICGSVWTVLKRSPNVTLKRSKIVVGFFLK